MIIGDDHRRADRTFMGRYRCPHLGIDRLAARIPSMSHQSPEINVLQ